ncbi:hypothetical protein JCGZ_14879 [Jatropha curcas]|uniref:Uncharacterized protein n=1 Tax=Jatropha curcas TaxID=180498 RepID=A0A067K7R4_JATCU|nr:hypothetical protein JCGZ_14879 [Jatropha curcas]
MFNTSCESTEVEACRDDSAALLLKPLAIASILLAGAAGVAILSLESNAVSYIQMAASLLSQRLSRPL